jgi:ABC-type branched-subunit amino acid transport system ATPase component
MDEAPSAASPLLEAIGITKRFAGIAALIDVSVTVDRGECVALIGPNGAGKSTLFNCMAGVTRPDRGIVRFDGHDLGRMPPYRRARLGLARTFQQIELFPGLTVLDHVVVSVRAERRAGGLVRDLTGRSRPTASELERCRAVLELVGLDRDADRQIESLSLGRARVVELARALVREPTLLFLDEPSSGLDSQETDAMATVIETVRAHRPVAVLLCEHDVSFVRRLASRTSVLDCGKLIAAGPTAEVLDSDAVREAYVGTVA